MFRWHGILYMLRSNFYFIAFDYFKGATKQIYLNQKSMFASFAIN